MQIVALMQSYPENAQRVEWELTRIILLYFKWLMMIGFKLMPGHLIFARINYTISVIAASQTRRTISCFGFSVALPPSTVGKLSPPPGGRGLPQRTALESYNSH